MRSYKMAVVADTHVPDRTPALDRKFLSALREAKVDLILHAGDISVQSVLDELETIAPVLAVRGNRDILLRKQLPMVQTFEKFGVKIALMHGHMNFWTYWFDKFQYIFEGYNRDRYASRLIQGCADARVFVYGHSHHAEKFWHDERYYFNPGSITYGDRVQKTRSWGMIEVFEDGKVDGRIVPHQ